MPKLTASICLALSLAGCGNSEPDRLDYGTHAALYDPEKTSLYLEIDGPELARIPVGTRVEVISDQATNENLSEWRKVQFRIQEGPLKGRAGKAPRWNLRPATD